MTVEADERRLVNVCCGQQEFEGGQDSPGGGKGRFI